MGNGESHMPSNTYKEISTGCVKQLHDLINLRYRYEDKSVFSLSDINEFKYDDVYNDILEHYTLIEANTATTTLDNSKFNNKIWTKYPILKVINYSNIVIAGDFICAFINNLQCSRIDMYVIEDNNDNDTKHLLRSTLESLSTHCTNNGTGFRIIINDDLIRFTIINKTQKLDLVFHLTTYKNINDLLYSFPIGSSSIAYNGKELLLSYHGMISYKYMTNILVPDQFNKLKIYCTRGFSILVPFVKCINDPITSIEQVYLQNHLDEDGNNSYIISENTPSNILRNKRLIKDDLLLASVEFEGNGEYYFNDCYKYSNLVVNVRKTIEELLSTDNFDGRKMYDCEKLKYIQKIFGDQFLLEAIRNIHKLDITKCVDTCTDKIISNIKLTSIKSMLGNSIKIKKYCLPEDNVIEYENWFNNAVVGGEFDHEAYDYYLDVNEGDKDCNNGSSDSE